MILDLATWLDHIKTPGSDAALRWRVYYQANFVDACQKAVIEGEGRAIRAWQNWLSTDDAEYFFTGAAGSQGERHRCCVSAILGFASSVTANPSLSPDDRAADVLRAHPCLSGGQFPAPFWHDLEGTLLGRKQVPIAEARILFPLIIEGVGGESPAVLAEFHVQALASKDGEPFLAPDQILLRDLGPDFASIFGLARDEVSRALGSDVDGRSNVRVSINALDPPDEQKLMRQYQLRGRSAAGALTAGLWSVWQRVAVPQGLVVSIALDADRSGRCMPVGAEIEKAREALRKGLGTLIVAADQPEFLDDWARAYGVTICRVESVEDLIALISGREPAPRQRGDDFPVLADDEIDRLSSAQADREVQRLQEWLFRHALPQQLGRSRRRLNLAEKKRILQCATDRIKSEAPEDFPEVDVESARRAYSNAVGIIAPRVSPEEKIEAVLGMMDLPDTGQSFASTLHQPNLMRMDEDTRQTLSTTAAGRLESFRPWLDGRLGPASVDPLDYAARIRSQTAKVMDLSVAELLNAAGSFVLSFMEVTGSPFEDELAEEVEEGLRDVDPDDLRLLVISAYTLAWEYAAYGEALVGGVPLSAATDQDLSRGAFELEEGLRVFQIVNNVAVADWHERFFSRRVVPEIRAAAERGADPLAALIRNFSGRLSAEIVDELTHLLDAGIAPGTVAERFIQEETDRLAWMRSVSGKDFFTSVLDDKGKVGAPDGDNEQRGVRLRRVAKPFAETAAEAFGRFEWRRSAENAQQALELDPDNSDLRALYALSLLENGETGEAKRLVEVALTDKRESPTVLAAAARIYLRMDQPVKALSICRELLQVQPGSFPGNRIAFQAALQHPPALAGAWELFAATVGATKNERDRFAGPLKSFERGGESAQRAFLETVDNRLRRPLSLSQFGLGLAAAQDGFFGNAEQMFFTCGLLQPGNPVLCLWRARNLCVLHSAFLPDSEGREISVKLLETAIRVIGTVDNPDRNLIGLVDQLQLVIANDAASRHELSVGEADALETYEPLIPRQEQATALLDLEFLATHVSTLATALAGDGRLESAARLYENMASEVPDVAGVQQLADRDLSRFPKARALVKKALQKRARKTSSGPRRAADRPSGDSSRATNETSQRAHAPTEVIPIDLSYTPTHFWIRWDADATPGELGIDNEVVRKEMGWMGEVLTRTNAAWPCVTVGLTDRGQQLLGDLIQVRLPPAGTRVHPFREIGEVRSHLHRTALLLPIDGLVVGTNGDTVSTPGLANREPYDRGWLVKAMVRDPRFLIEGTLSADEYRSLIREGR